MILSFDIGIKNLAYCFLDLDCSIKDWNVLNIIEEPHEECHNCDQIFQNGKHKGDICKKKAKFLINDNTYSCKKHSLKFPSDTITPLIIPKPKKVKDITLLNLSIKLINTLDSHLLNKINTLQPSQVLIELQPRFNPKMKNISMMLYNYLIIRFMTDCKDDGFLKNIKFINAKKKLSVYEGPYIPCNLKNKYGRTKYLGIKYCEYLIQNDAHFSNFLNEHKKKDDLCDSYMQGLWYLKNKMH